MENTESTNHATTPSPADTDSKKVTNDKITNDQKTTETEHKASSIAKVDWKRFIQNIKGYFNVADDLEPQADIEASIRAGVSFKGSQLLILVFAIFVASLGLNTNSIPVIIGAMLISPLMGPIIGMGLGIGIHDYALLRRGAKNILMAVLGSVIASAIYFMISPQYEGSSQLLARTSPSIYDVFIAIFGGTAGIVSIACRNKGQVMPGVAIATSLMPPLCTVGYGLATFQSQYFFGALYLFFTNMVFILFATWIGIKLMGLKSMVYDNTKRAKRVQTIVYCIVGLTITLSAYLTVIMFKKNIFLNDAANFVNTEMIFPNTQVLNHKEYIKGGKGYIDVTLIGQALPKDSLQVAMINKLDSAGLGGTILTIKQGFTLANAEFDESRSAGEFYSLMQQEINTKQSQIDSLRNIIDSRANYADLTESIAPELRVLFPGVNDIAVSSSVVTRIEGQSTPNDSIAIAFIRTSKGLNAEQRAKLRSYLSLRLELKNLDLIINPANFPWDIPDAAAK